MKAKPLVTYGGEILHKMLRYNQDLIKKILNEHYLMDGVRAVVVHGRDNQKYEVIVKPLYDYYEENGIERAQQIVSQLDKKDEESV